MAKYNSSAFGNISGEVLGVVASSNKGINFIKNKAKVTDAKTERQLARRAIYGEFCTVWDEKRIADAQNIGITSGIKESAFKITLKNCLKFSESASMLFLAYCPTNGTMSAPVYVNESSSRGSIKSFRLNGKLLYQGSGDLENIFLCGSIFAESLFAEAQRFDVLQVFNPGKVTAIETAQNPLVPDIEYYEAIGEKVFRSFWFFDKKTGQISKPLLLACHNDGTPEIFYPFGK